MDSNLIISPIYNNDAQQIVDLILPIQQIEFNVPVTLEDQPDLLDIEQYYHQTGGGFWGAKQGTELVGSIALISIGQQAGALRKMFVKKEFRGKETGVAQQLLDTLLLFCREKAIVEIYLGTVVQLKAAQRFYERNGFVRVRKEDLPSYFPRMETDNIFYHKHLD